LTTENRSRPLCTFRHIQRIRPNLCETLSKIHPKFLIGAAGYLTGASNLRKRSRDSPVRTGQPLDDDAKVEDASEK
jgi:hypothetical protein